MTVEQITTTEQSVDTEEPAPREITRLLPCEVNPGPDIQRAIEMVFGWVAPTDKHTCATHRVRALHLIAYIVDHTSDAWDVPSEDTPDDEINGDLLHTMQALLIIAGKAGEASEGQQLSAADYLFRFMDEYAPLVRKHAAVTSVLDLASAVECGFDVEESAVLTSISNVMDLLRISEANNRRNDAEKAAKEVAKEAEREKAQQVA